jgi:glycosyltransferase involved in cell wall biosynthesis
MTRRPRVVVVYSRFLEADGRPAIGGVETYLQMLGRALAPRFDVVVCQPSPEPWERHLGPMRVVGAGASSIRGTVRFAERALLTLGDVLLFASDQATARTAWKRTLVIQHGLYWDLPSTSYSAGRVAAAAPLLYKWFDNARNRRRIAPFEHVVCVDHCYPLWYRATDGGRRGKNFWVIPNAAGDPFFDVPHADRTSDGDVRLLFPRRLIRFRGTRLFAGVARRLLDNGAAIRVTVAGDGPDKEQMQAILPPGPRVTYSVASHDEIPSMMATHDVIVVPSLGSEGTSLAVVEGMACGRTVVASAVGGITNILIDGYNGLLAQPTFESLLDRLTRAVGEPRLRERLGSAARAVAEASFREDVWSDRWLQVLDAASKS